VRALARLLSLEGDALSPSTTDVSGLSELARQIFPEKHEFVSQRRIYRTGQQVTEQAKDYFTTVFVRSANSVTTVEACAKAGQWNAARLEQLRSWVRPSE
jgi:hypothetical protein